MKSFLPVTIFLICLIGPFAALPAVNPGDTGVDPNSSTAINPPDSLEQLPPTGAGAFSTPFSTPCIFIDETGFMKESPRASAKTILRLLKGDVLYYLNETTNGWTKIQMNDSIDPKCCARCNCRLIEGWVVRSSIKLDAAASVDSLSDAAVRGRAWVRNHYAAAGIFRDVMFQGTVAAGMSNAAVRGVFGEPESVKRTTGSFGVHEQWVYGGVSFFFANGVLKGWKE